MRERVRAWQTAELLHDIAGWPEPVPCAVLEADRSPSEALDELTAREREILALMAEGRSNQGIAERLGLELKTVEGHIGQVFGKLGLEPAQEDHRRVLAVLTYLRGTET